MPFENVESLKIYIKKLIVNKKCCKEKLVLERRLVCKKKEKNCVKRGCRCKKVDAYETIAECLSPLFAQTQVPYLTFIFLTLQTLTKLKTTFGRNLLYWTF
jgi:hypothetical protein